MADKFQKWNTPSLTHTIEDLPYIFDLYHSISFLEDYSPYDFSGQKAYTNACKRYKALPSSSFFKNLADSEVINMAHYGMGPKGVKALSIPMVVSITFMSNTKKHIFIVQFISLQNP